ncbi:MAG TPA: DoxX family protein [Gemmatimonadales bacterium]|nr:DoxX family protein [Gemmatimonadales bacterium]
MTARAWSRPPAAGIDPRFAPYAALLLRVALGIVFVAHAWLKATGLTLPGTAAFFEAHGFPGWAAYPVFAVELLGGLALIAGWRTRPVAAVLTGVVLGAFRVHWDNGWYFAQPEGGWEYLAVLVAGLMAVALLGPGAPALSATRGSPRAAPPGSSSRT